MLFPPFKFAELLLFLESESQRLVRVIQPVELGNGGVGSLIVVAEFRGIFSFAISLCDKVIPLIDVLERFWWLSRCIHLEPPGSPNARTVPLTFIISLSPSASDFAIF